MKDQRGNNFSDEEAAKRRDEALKRALGMPHKPHKQDQSEQQRKKAPKKK